MAISRARGKVGAPRCGDVDALAQVGAGYDLGDDVANAERTPVVGNLAERASQVEMGPARD